MDPFAVLLIIVFIVAPLIERLLKAGKGTELPPAERPQQRVPQQPRLGVSLRGWLIRRGRSLGLSGARRRRDGGRRTGERRGAEAHIRRHRRVRRLQQTRLQQARQRLERLLTRLTADDADLADGHLSRDP